MESLSSYQLGKFAKDYDQEEPPAAQQLRSSFRALVRDSTPYVNEVGMTIFVRTLTGKTLTIKVDSIDSIAKVKSKISEEYGPPISQQRLFFAGREIQDGYLLADYKIKNETTMHLVLRLKGGGFCLRIRLPNEEILEIGVDLSETIQSVKDKISKEVPNNNQTLTLFFFGQELEDQKTLSDYRISSSDMLSLVYDFKSHEKIDSFNVRIYLNRDSYSVSMKSLDTVEALKEILEVLPTYSSQETLLLYEGKILLNEKKLAEYGIDNHAKIFVIPELDGGDCLRFMQIVESTIINGLEDMKLSLDFLKKQGKLEEFTLAAQRKIRDVKTKNPYLKDTPDVILLAIAFWTSNILYEELNKTLRFNEDLTSWNIYLKYFISGLKLMPFYRGKAYRGFSKKADLDAYEKGKLVIWKTISALSKSQDIADSIYSNKDGIVFEVDVFSARDISSVSNYPNENEVVILPYSRFEVIDVDKNSKPVKIKLREIPTPRSAKVAFWLHDSPRNDHDIARTIEDNGISCLYCPSKEDVFRILDTFQWIPFLKNTDFVVTAEIESFKIEVLLAEKWLKDWSHWSKGLIFCRDENHLRENCDVDHLRGYISNTQDLLEVEEFPGSNIDGGTFRIFSFPQRDLDPMNIDFMTQIIDNIICSR